MQATRTPARRASACPARLDAKPLSPPSEAEFLDRFGDAIDDRIAEVLDELLDQRDAARLPRRLPQVLAVVSLILALAANVWLRPSAIVAATIVPVTAAICLTMAWARRPPGRGSSK